MVADATSMHARGTDRMAPSDLRLTVAARPENVVMVRRVIETVARELELPPATTDDIRLAVTEACTNVVRHAYAEPDGTIDVLMRPRSRLVEIVVTDEGRGMGSSSDLGGPGLGLPLISELADSVVVERGRTRGSRLAMSFARHHPATLPGLS